MALAKNQLITLKINAVTSEGSGIGRYTDKNYPDGFVVFVPQTAVGDEILCKILKTDKKYAFGKLEKIVSPSPDRVTDPTNDCAVFGKCGGCCWRHVTYEAELRYKQQVVADALQRIGGISITPEPIVGSQSTERYRNKAQYPVATVNNESLVGFYAPRSHRIVAHTDCKLQPKEFTEIVDAVMDWVRENNVSLYDESANRGLLRHIYIRKGEESGEILLCLVCTSGKVPQAKRLVETFTAKFPQLVGICVNCNPDDTNVILGKNTYTLWGKGYLTDVLCEKAFRLSPHSFYQVNKRQAETLYTIAKQEAELTGGEVLLDLYCGTGTIGLTMAESVKELIGVEIVPQAVEDARLNARLNGVENARFICADAAKAAEQLRNEHIRPDVVIVDPPRKGCGEEVVRIIGDMTPKRVVYVSCNPATLARDTQYFANCGYEIKRVMPVDMFPRTPHVECVALFIRKD